jgi:hypothetical protein
MQEVCEVLERLVHEGTLSQYAIGGATAAGFHGEPLATRDVDVFVLMEAATGQLIVSLDSIYTKLKDMGFSEFEEEGILIHGLPVQFLAASPGLEAEAVETAMVVEWDDHRMRVMRPEYLGAIALAVGRPKDRARIVYLAELPDFDLPTFREILHRYKLIERWQQWSAALGLDP